MPVLSGLFVDVGKVLGANNLKTGSGRDIFIVDNLKQAQAGIFLRLYS